MIKYSVDGTKPQKNSMKILIIRINSWNELFFLTRGDETVQTHTVSFKTKLTFCNCKNNVIAIVITVERTIFTDVLALVIKIICNVIMYVAICDVVISVATYAPTAFYTWRFLSAALPTLMLSYWIATELYMSWRRTETKEDIKSD